MWSYGVHLSQLHHHHHYHHHYTPQHQRPQKIPYSHKQLLDYSPAKVEQPLPTDSILVPKEYILDIKLRCPPDMEIIRLPVQSAQDNDHDISVSSTQPEMNYSEIPQLESDRDDEEEG